MTDQALATRWSELARVIATTTLPGDDVVDRVLLLARDSVPGVRWVSITRSTDRSCRTIASSDPVADSVDTVQYETGEGPCLAAVREGTVVVSDFAAETRWPAFIAGVQDLAALQEPTPGAAVSQPLTPAGRPDLSLNLYADRPGASVSAAAGAAAGVALALTAIDERRRADNLQTGLATSRQIGAAIGILMYRHRTTYEQGFAALRTASQRLHRKVRDIADEVLRTGELPGPPAQP